MERLATSDSGNSDWQRDLSLVYEKVGDVQAAQGNLRMPSNPTLKPTASLSDWRFRSRKYGKAERACAILLQPRRSSEGAERPPAALKFIRPPCHRGALASSDSKNMELQRTLAMLNGKLATCRKRTVILQTPRILPQEPRDPAVAGAIRSEQCRLAGRSRLGERKCWRRSPCRERLCRRPQIISRRTRHIAGADQGGPQQQGLATRPRRSISKTARWPSIWSLP